MAGLVTTNGLLVTAEGRPVHIELQAAIEASGPTPPGRAFSTERENRVFNTSEENILDKAEKTPVALLDYTRSWAGWLGEGETIVTSEWFVPEGLHLSASEKTDSTATVWLEGGQANRTYRITNRVTTSENRVDERSILIHCRER